MTVINVFGDLNVDVNQFRLIMEKLRERKVTAKDFFAVVERMLDSADAPAERSDHEA